MGYIGQGDATEHAAANCFFDIHAAKANGGTSPGLNSPPTTQIFDLSGNGNHVALQNSAYINTSGFAGDGSIANPYKLALDGVDDAGLAQQNNIFVLGENENLTINMGIYLPTNSPSYTNILDIGTASGRNGWSIRLGGTSQILLYCTTSNGNTVLWSDANCLVAGYNDIIATINRTENVNIYNNNVRAGTASFINGDFSNSTDQLHIGESNNSNAWFNGGLYYSRLYKKIFTSDDRAQNYVAGPTWPNDAAISEVLATAYANKIYAIPFRAGEGLRTKSGIILPAMSDAYRIGQGIRKDSSIVNPLAANANRAGQGIRTESSTAQPIVSVSSRIAVAVQTVVSWARRIMGRAVALTSGIKGGLNCTVGVRTRSTTVGIRTRETKVGVKD